MHESQSYDNLQLLAGGGRIVKGGEALYKTARGLEAAGQSLKAYDQASRTLKVLSTSEKSINALLAGNGVTEAATGRDMFGKPLTEEQRKNSLLQGIMMMNVFSRGKLVSNEEKIAVGEQAKAFKDYVVKHVQQAKENMRNLRQNRWTMAMDGVPNDFFNMVDDVEDVQKTHSMAKIDEVREAGGKNVSDEAKVQATGKIPSVFADRAKLEGHFDKHGEEFDGLYKNADDYLEGARKVIKNGIKVKYEYRDEIRIGYVKFIGNNKDGKAKFEFVGTNNKGEITTYHTQSGKKFWKTINGKNVPIITPAE